MKARIALAILLITLVLTLAVQAKPTYEEEPTSSGKVIWYGSSIQDVSQPNMNDAVVHLQNLGILVEKRDRPVSNIADARAVVIAPAFFATFSSGEITELISYVNSGGRLIFAVDTDYFHCDPDSTCAMEIARNFGIGFDGDIQQGTITPAIGQSGHIIWTAPNSLSSFSRWCCDAHVRDILDPSNVKVLGTVSGVSVEVGEPETYLHDVPAIVVNEDTAFNGGKVLGIGYNMFVGLNGDFRLFDNIMNFMLELDLNPPSLIVKKHVINNNGGNKQAFDFTIHVKSEGVDLPGSPTPGSEAGRQYYYEGSGIFVVSEDQLPSYTQTSVTGDCAPDGSVTLDPGTTKICTITNDDQRSAKCNGLVATIMGTDGDDAIEGTSGDDVITGFAGNDIINGGGGNDTICGAKGNDEILGGDGDDYMNGGNGDDSINGQAGDDDINGKGGNDTMLGGDGQDVIFGAAGDDTIDCQDGTDFANGGLGADTALNCEITRKIP